MEGSVLENFEERVRVALAWRVALLDAVLGPGGDFFRGFELRFLYRDLDVRIPEEVGLAVEPHVNAGPGVVDFDRLDVGAVLVELVEALRELAFRGGRDDLVVRHRGSPARRAEASSSDATL